MEFLWKPITFFQYVKLYQFQNYRSKFLMTIHFFFHVSLQLLTPQRLNKNGMKVSIFLISLKLFYGPIEIVADIGIRTKLYAVLLHIQKHLYIWTLMMWNGDWFSLRQYYILFYQRLHLIILHCNIQICLRGLYRKYSNTIFHLSSTKNCLLK